MGKHSKSFDEMDEQSPTSAPPVITPATAAAATGAGAYSRQASIDRYATDRHKKRRRKGIIIALVAILVALLALAAAGWAYVNSVVTEVEENFSEGVTQELRDTLVKPKAPEDPFYVLLLGTDASLEREEDDVFEGTYRTDSIILTRVDPESKKVTMVSFPRDTQVELADHGQQKINAAYAFGGAPLAVQTVSGLAEVDIAHFVMIDMDGLVGIIDALGGVEVYVPMEIDDDYTGHLDQGLQTLDGQQALIFARSRHAYDAVGDGDLIRTSAQRAIIAAIAKKVLSCDPITIAGTVQQLSKYVQTDLTVGEIANYAASLQGMDMTTDLYSGIVPTEAEEVDGVWVNWLLEDEWREMMARVDAGLPPTDAAEVDEGSGMLMSQIGDGTGVGQLTYDPEADMSGGVVVLNGSGTEGLDAKYAATLEAAGFFTAAGGATQNSGYTNTLVVYFDSNYRDEAAAVALTLGGSATVAANNGHFIQEGNVLVIVGANDATAFAGV